MHRTDSVPALMELTVQWIRKIMADYTNNEFITTGTNVMGGKEKELR